MPRKMQNCPHCGFAFDPELVDMSKHIPRCKENLREQGEENARRRMKGLPPKRRGFRGW